MIKIFSWNCSGGFRKKFQKIININPDIIIIQQCEDPHYYPKEFASLGYNNFIWDGENKNKGLAVFSKSNLILKKLEWNGSFSFSIPDISSNNLTWLSVELKHFLPFSINEKYNFLAVWTKGNENQVFGYIGQFWKYILANKESILSLNPIILGDFNSNVIWDKDDRWWNHSEVVALLDNWKFKSLYHEIFVEEQGNEKQPTFFLQRNKEKDYHIDYSFLPSVLIKKSKINIGKFEDWIDFSDHLPLMIEINE